MRVAAGNPRSMRAGGITARTTSRSSVAASSMCDCNCVAAAGIARGASGTRARRCASRARSTSFTCRPSCRFWAIRRRSRSAFSIAWSRAAPKRRLVCARQTVAEGLELHERDTTVTVLRGSRRGQARQDCPVRRERQRRARPPRLPECLPLGRGTRSLQPASLVH